MKYFIFLLSIFILTSCGSSSSLNQSKDNGSKAKIPDIDIKKSDIIINEILPINTHTIMDSDYYTFSDYIELHNDSNHTIDVGSYYLSDSDKNITKWQIPKHTKIEAKGYLIIWADKKDSKLHTNFKLSNKKEVVILSDKDKRVIDIVSYQNPKRDISLLQEDDTIYYMTPTPNKKNGKKFNSPIFAKTPTFSKDSGLYEKFTDIQLSSDENSKIYYTSDGSIASNKSTLYNNFIELEESASIRAIAYEDGKLPSDLITKSFILHNIQKEHKLPIVSLTIDPTYLYDDIFGIYTKGRNGVMLSQCVMGSNEIANYARDWKRAVYVEYFDEDMVKRFEFEADLSIGGQCSRVNPQKTLKIDLSKKYGQKSFSYKLFDTKDIKKFRDFKLRVGREGYYILDALAASIVANSDLDIDYQAYKPALLYLNGKLWGVYNIRESKGKDFIRSNYPDVDVKNIDIIVNSEYAKRGDMIAFKRVDSFIKEHDLTIDTNYKTLSKMVDLKNFIDYISLMIYSANIDWIRHNTRAWRERKEKAKWRWMLDDLDMGFGMYDSGKNFFEVAIGKHTYSNGLKAQSTLSELFKALLKNSDFKKRFKDRFNQLLDSTFRSQNIANLANEIWQKRASYKNINAKYEQDISSVEYFLDTNFKEFRENRVTILKKQLEEFLP